MSYVYDWKTGTSEFVMWDASFKSEEPVLRAQTVDRVPNGFHAYFVKDKDLE